MTHETAPVTLVRPIGGFMFGSLGMPELLVILVIVIVIFGASRLPQLGRGLGEGISNFKNGIRGTDEKKVVEEKKEKTA
jgi:sec-independent protein translocase protein TatA